MASWLKPLSHGARFCTECLVSVLCWTLWLALSALLVVQAAIALTHELAVPGFVLRAFEGRFAAAHIDARFGRVLFDPTGRLMVENLRLTLPGFEDPAINARAAFIELNPWLLAAGRVEVSRVRATGVDLFIPAMLAPSGKAEKGLSNLELDLEPGAEQVAVDALNATIAGVAVDLRGAVQLPALPARKGVAPLSLVDELAGHYADFSRRVIGVTRALTAFERPAVHVTLSPSPTRGAIAAIELDARAAAWPPARDLALSGLRAATRLPLLGDTPTMALVHVAFDEARLADGVVARDGGAWVRGVLTPAKFTFAAREARLSLREVSARGFTLDALSADVTPGPLPQVAADVIASCAGAPLAVHGHADLAAKSAVVRLDGALSPGLLAPIGAQLHRELEPFVALHAPIEVHADAAFDAGWKFRDATGRIAVRDLVAHGVPLDRAAGELAFDGRHFAAHHAMVQVGEDVARGIFEQDLQTREYRFLLEGRLRPLDITPWFHEWWENIFTNFDFAAAAPAASVDVRGRWHAPHESEVFVFADATKPMVRGVAFDRLRTLLFIRPNFIDGLEVHGARGEARVSGTFERHIDAEEKEWRDMDFAVTSSFPLADAERLLGPRIAEELEPFTFETPPVVKVAGHVDGPGIPGPGHHALDIDAKATGAFTVYQFPGRDLSFTAKLRDHDLTLDRVEATVAGGRLSGTANLTGEEKARRLSLDARLAGADLASAVATVTHYKALRRGQPPPPPDNFFSGKPAVKLDLALKADGDFTDLYSYHGAGSAAVNGPELGEVRLLGLLSELLNFTALRFTAARGDFKVEGPKLVFPAVSLTGRNSAIEAHGTYAVDRDALDFNARVYPFQESKSLLSVVGAVLAPISTALEVKLTGPLAQPNWAFVIGPTNLLRSLAQPAAGAENPKPEQPAEPEKHP
ncbi:MAG TPA: AsmA-like C-terminal region-containing protein [Opitutus sp.]|nr:AsmA-like C-terminal region-containing protein [Opitutus sp.]